MPIPFYIASPDEQARQLAAMQMPAPDMPNLTAPAMPRVTMAAPPSPSPSLPPITLSPQASSDVAERDRLLSTGSGVSQIHNPFLRGIARAGDIAASVFAPGLAVSLPGTTLHHDVLVTRAQQRVEQDNKDAQDAASLAQTQAGTRHTNDLSADLENPKPNYTPIQTDEGLTAFDSSTGKGTLVPDASGGVLGAPSKAVAPHYISQDDGSIVAIAPDESGQPKATVVYKGDPKIDTEVTKLEVGGKPHSVIVNKKTGETVKDLGETGEKPPSVSMSTGTYSLASLPDGKGGTRAVLLNNKTGEVKDAPEGLSKAAAAPAGAAPPMTTADKNRASLAQIAMNNLDQVQDIVTRRPDLLGKMGLVKSTADLLGSNDPDLVALGNEVHNFAMANAGIHGSRSFQNVQAAEQELLGHFKNGAPGIQGGIDANRKNLQAVINPNAPAAQSFTDGGTVYRIPADQVAAFKKDHPNAR